MFFLIPFFKHLINTLSQRDMKKLILICVFLFSIMPLAVHQDLFQTEWGYSTLWLSVLYIIGAYIKRYQIFEKKKSKLFLWIYVFCIVTTWLSKFIIEILTQNLIGRAVGGTLLVSYISPTILLAGISLLIFFANLEFPSWIERIISIAAPLAFSVYLIHVHPIIWDNIINNGFIHFIGFSPIKFVISVLGITFVIYIICSLIDKCRVFLFQLFRMKEFCIWLESVLRKVVKKCLGIMKISLD